MSEYEFNCMSVRCGEEIKDLFSYLTNIKEKRACFKELENYLKSDHYYKYMLSLRGLRRTGKTTMMIQALKDLPKEDLDKACFIQIQNNPNSAQKPDTFYGLYNDINYLVSKKKFKYIFVDEVTALKGFIDNGGILADMFSGSGEQNVKIVLSGTDSLGFQFVENGSALGRQLSVRTTYVPFNEFARLLGENNFDKFIEYGGTLVPETPDGNPDYKWSPFASPSVAGQYMDSAISQNILHSLQKCKIEREYNSLKPLIDNGQLRQVINHIVAYINVSHLFTEKNKEIAKKAKKLYSYAKIDQMKNVIDEHWQSLDLEKINSGIHPQTLDQFEGSIIDEYYRKLGIKTTQNLPTLTEDQLNNIEKYLLSLDLAKEIPCKTITINQYINEDGIPKGDIAKESDEDNHMFTITQPGMRFSLNNEMLNILHSKNIIVSKQELFSEVNSVKGRILEDIVLVEMKNAIDNWNRTIRHQQNGAYNPAFAYDAFKLRVVYKEIIDNKIPNKKTVVSHDKDIDMVIYDPYYKGFRLFEIKHNTNLLNIATVHLLSDKVEWVFNNVLDAPIIDRTVLYRGKDSEACNVQYRNLENFLTELDPENIGSALSTDEEITNDIDKFNVSMSELHSCNEYDDTEDYGWER